MDTVGDAVARIVHHQTPVTSESELQALVYDILPPTSAIIDYAIGLQQLSANGQLLDGAQMAVSL